MRRFHAREKSRDFVFFVEEISLAFSTDRDTERGGEGGLYFHLLFFFFLFVFFLSLFVLVIDLTLPKSE